MALRSRLALALLLAGGVVACGKESSSPTAPTGPVLVLTYTGPCVYGSAVLTIDGKAMGRVNIPGTISFPMASGSHTLQVGTTPAVPFDMPSDRDLILTNVPSVCP